MSRILLCCDDGTFRSEVAFKRISEKLGYSNVKIVEGGMDEYLEKFPLTAKDKVKWKTADEPGQDLSDLVSGVDTRQAGQMYY